MTREEAIKAQIDYSWAVLEHKWRYYVGRGHGVKTISDEKYDKIEGDYKKLCSVLKLDAAASSMVGFDLSRPSCRLVNIKMCMKYKLDPEKMTVL